MKHTFRNRVLFPKNGFSDIGIVFLIEKTSVSISRIHHIFIRIPGVQLQSAVKQHIAPTQHFIEEVLGLVRIGCKGIVFVIFFPRTLIKRYLHGKHHSRLF